MRNAGVLLLATCTSLVAFLLCTADKHRARRGAARIRESTLLFWALVGGAPGLLAAMTLFHHKVRKAAFLLRFLAVALLQLAGAVAWRRPGFP